MNALHYTPRTGPSTMNLLPSTAALAIAAVLLLPAGAQAADDHGHDHGDAAPAATGPALPRFAAVSEAFELVGVLSGRQLTLYLDRFADNHPVRGATIELEIGDAKLKAQPHGDDGEYEVMLATEPAPGLLPVTATITAGSEVDLLAGELDIHEAAHAAEAAHRHSWQEYASWGAGAIAALALLAFVGRRLLAARGTNRVPSGGAA
jgi:hypothetical protein